MLDRLSDALYKWRGIAGWPESEALVSACIWTPDAELGGGVGNYRVLFSYPVKDGVQTAKLGINGVNGRSPFRVGDTFTLRYHPKHPARFYYANEMSQMARVGLVAIFLLVGGLAALLVIGLDLK
ncbi:hypothetical protein Terro_3189 [Terriglobus roseus DSM 18391]|uniref:DUF3592 domain-containing protein n=1 Tax=Terriglobus roseus (strain DSM 18391 / NRRL B-41598 / KBS 63) TaxID=926566 RepID=I3ZJJ3_TERRK|nr:hypothetical protein Terro_3189 [Terriglobus roseus DSM 18391]